MKYPVLSVGGIDMLQVAPSQFYWYALAPRLALHDDNSPQISWVPDLRRLSLTTAWGPTSKQMRILASIRDLLAELDPEISFELAPIKVNAVSVTVLSRDGEPVAMADGEQISNIAPYHASFVFDLDESQAANFENVPKYGGHPPVRIEYFGFLQVAVRRSARCDVVGDASLAVANLAGNRPDAKGRKRSISTIEARREVERALSDGELESITSFMGGESSELRDLVEREARKVTAEKFKELADEAQDDMDDSDGSESEPQAYLLSAEHGCTAFREIESREDIPIEASSISS